MQYEATGEEYHLVRAGEIVDRLFATYLAGPKAGLWYDRFALDGRIAVDHVPASILYHLLVPAAEMIRLGLARGAKPATLMGLSGLGDLSLTCNGLQSRNMSLGVALGEQRRLADILGERRSVAEGVHSAGAVVALARRLGVEMPISAAVDAIVNGGADIDTTIATLLERPFTVELTALP